MCKITHLKIRLSGAYIFQDYKVIFKHFSMKISYFQGRLKSQALFKTAFKFKHFSRSVGTMLWYQLNFTHLQEHSAPTGARNSSLGHPNMTEASLGKNIPKVIPSLLHVFSGWYLQGLVKWCVSLSRPQNVWSKLRHIARRGGDISLRDARISTSGCPNLPRLNKLGCPKLRKDARIWVKMPESRLTIRCRDRWLNNSIVLFIHDEDDYICSESNAQWYS